MWGLGGPAQLNVVSLNLNDLNLAAKSLLLSSDVLFKDFLCFLNLFSFLSSLQSFYFFRIKFGVNSLTAVDAWIVAWAWAFDICFFVAGFLWKSAFNSVHQCGFLILFLFKSFWCIDNCRFVVDPIEWILDSIDFSMLVLAKWEFRLYILRIYIFNINLAGWSNFDILNSWYIFGNLYIVNRLWTHFGSFTKNLFGFRRDGLIVLLFSGLNFLFLRLIIDG